MKGIEVFRDMMQGLYNMLNEVEVNILDVVTVTLWQLYLFGAIAGVAVYAFIKFINS